MRKPRGIKAIAIFVMFAASLAFMSPAGNLMSNREVVAARQPLSISRESSSFDIESLSSNISGMYWVNSVAWNGSYWLIGGVGKKRLIKYDGGSTYTDLTSNISGMSRVTSVAWNGSYWLIGGSDSYYYGDKTLIKYDGGSTYTDLTSNISGMLYVCSIAWNGSYWLIGGGPRNNYKTTLKIYDGSTFSDLSSNISGMNQKVNSVAWNGSYWLIGGDGSCYLVKYDGGSTYTDLTSNISDTSGVTDIAWNGSYWLIGGDNALVKYDGGSTYSDLTSNIPGMSDFNSVAWNGSYWLIGGYPGGAATTLVKYDGSTFTDITSNISDMYYVTSVAWNGSCWLIGGDNGNVERDRIQILIEYDGSTFADLTSNISGIDVCSTAWNESYWLIGGGGIKKLIKYDGSTFIDLTSNISGMGSVWCFAWNGSYWLICGDGSDSNTKALVKYDGSTFTDLTSNFGMSPIKSLSWNGSYWLIGGGGSAGYTKTLVKYDGSTFTDLTSNISGMSLVDSLSWNGSYWLIGGLNSSGDMYLVKYYGGSTFTDLTSNFGMSSIESLSWNGSYWLIGGWGEKKLIKYDGSTFTDLTSNISGMLYVTSIAWNGSYWMIGGWSSDGKILVEYDGGSTSTNLSSNVSGLGIVSYIAWNGSYWMIGGGTNYETLYRLTPVPTAPTINTTAPTGKLPDGVTSGGRVWSDGGSPVTERGVCWSTSEDPTIEDNRISAGAGLGAFTEKITGLEPQTLYHVRAYATNSIGTSYGSDELYNFSPVVLVHGYNGDSTLWNNLEYDLEEQGIPDEAIFNFDYKDNNRGDPRQIAIDFDKKVTAFLANIAIEFPTTLPQVDIVCHSMGALVTRLWMEEIDRNPIHKNVEFVRQWIGIAPASHGSAHADHVCDTNAALSIPGGPAVLQLETHSNTVRAVDGFDTTETSDDGILEGLTAGVKYHVMVGVNQNPVQEDFREDVIQSILHWGNLKGRTLDRRTGTNCLGLPVDYNELTYLGDGFVSTNQSVLSGATNEYFEGINHNEMPRDSNVCQKVCDYVLDPSTAASNSCYDLKDDIASPFIKSYGLGGNIGASGGKWSASGNNERLDSATASGSFAFPVGSGDGSTYFVLTWPEGDMNLTLTSPSSVVYDGDEADVNYNKDTNSIQYQMETPEAGEWTATISTTDPPEEGLDYKFTTYCTGQPVLYVGTAEESLHYDVGESATILADLRSDDTPVTVAAVTGEVNKLGSKIADITLYDDGTNGDETASDGVYTSIYCLSQPGSYDIEIKATGGVSPDYFERNANLRLDAGDFAPAVFSVDPGEVTSGTTINATLSGACILDGATVKLSKAGEEDVEATDVDVVSGDEVTCELNLSGAALGDWNVTVTNPDGQSDTLSRGFEVKAAVPAISSLNPASGNVGSTVTINGTGFGASRGTSTAKFGDKTCTASDYVSWGDTQIKAKVPAGATGKVSVKVTTDGGTSNGKDFTVTEPAPPAPDAASIWYLAEGTTAWGFDTYISVENPNDEKVDIDVTYMTGDGAVDGGSFQLYPMSQLTINPEDKVGEKDFSTKIEAQNGKTIAVDRTMEWTGPGAASPEGHNSVGVNSAAKTWYLAEGSSNWGFECWLLIQNPGSAEATCTITYMIDGGDPVTVEKKVGANSRQSYDISKDIGAKDASIKVESTVPVIPERAMYRNNRREGHDSIGTTAPAQDYYLAEGAVGYGSGYTTYVLVQNPQGETNRVSVTYLTGSGEVQGLTLDMPANSRKTIKVNDQLPPGTDVSTHVHGDKPIIAERAMYWNSPAGEACHDSIGMAAAHSTFYLPDGETSNGRETWTLVSNPNSSDVKVEISYMTPTGTGNQVFTEIIPANSRKSFNMADKGISGRAAVMVTSKTTGKKIMCERAMYWNSRGAGTDTIGGFGD